MLLCGDVEENPEPDFKEMFESILQGQAEIRTELVGIKTRLESTELAINNFASCLNNIEINAKHLKAQTGSQLKLYMQL